MYLRQNQACPPYSLIMFPGCLWASYWHSDSLGGWNDCFEVQIHEVYVKDMSLLLRLIRTTSQPAYSTSLHSNAPLTYFSRSFNRSKRRVRCLSTFATQRTPPRKTRASTRMESTKRLPSITPCTTSQVSCQPSKMTSWSTSTLLLPATYLRWSSYITNRC